MRPNTAVATRVGDLGGEKVAMSFDQDSLAHIMSVLTDLYSDPELAIIREYSTNALDAQIRAGVTTPIEVYTPNGLSHFIKIKDNGIGMDAEDIRNVYSQYGASTKRSSDEFTGMLGLGCKAALTYTNQFTVNAVKDGVRTLVAVSRTEDGSGVMEILSEVETDDPNGVEISVPVKRNNLFHRKAVEFFRFWDEGTVLLNGVEPERVSGRKLTDDMILVPGMERDYIVMGNVPYPIDDEHEIHQRSWQSRFGVVARVEIGDVSFTPSREALQYTLRTEKTLKEIKERFNQNLKAAAQRDIDAAENAIDAVKALTDWSRILYGGIRRGNSFEYQGEEIPIDIRIKGGMNFRLHYSRGAVDETRYETIDSLTNRVVIYNYRNVDIKSHNREKIRLWFNKQDNLPNKNSVLVVDEIPEVFGKWVTDEYCFDWEDVKTVKAERQKSEKTEPTYDVFTSVGFKQKTLSEIGDEAVKALISSAQMKDFDNGFLRGIREEFPDIHLVRIATNRWEKLKRERQNVKTLHAVIAERYKEVVDSLTDDDKVYMMLDYNSRYILPNLDDSKIKDPELAQMVRVSKTLDETDTIKKYKRIKQMLGQFQYVENLDLGEIYQPFQRYPLLSSLSRNLEYTHGIYYVNAVYDELYK
ncbi:hypothetical protein SEA_SHAM_159 [Streptomyces phage Sham]|nr:hypothetical protein SEA_SHAM_159 [Streptomyces phage Sham]